ncbi:MULTISPECIES: LysR family transcriptional regulator [unclassified Pseudomonas]|uniref:LysR family transcriptional regulator n=1 Tax=unclassified Pseudomonas TaxID=196821 RepID=UPI000BCA5782|nr:MULTISPECIES: LysR family transcriptional regulator [unclassified Pseudomonas]PVZ13781.1 DNA-binding transcriptional LysR family regulator [Pseudomonas sp. URIL14HWK12:I12]PVZ24087.1 DNA-binding transcriptional LysR family regulator [Pseudomonas sp. URIL14HWK12:I10]PVZ33274.1 DNA-binding transcriptional LysR family regulator [Pseudomonas sp. URIL14HWK12:I11]SNZ10961.1 transcriptional regulator, LysR family [Pseudomonas sp. URIL14HWK12:I9]
MAINSEALRLLLAVIDEGSFSAAARTLHRVPSAVSMAIGQMEAELDLQLFERCGREARPTAAARALEAQARQITHQMAQFNAHALQLHQGLESRLTLAVAPELLSATWSAPLAELAKAYPTLEVEVRSAPQADALAMLHAGEAQLAIVFERPTMDEREDFDELASETLVAVIAPTHPILAQCNGRLCADDLALLRQIVVASHSAESAAPRVLLSRQHWLTDSHLATLSLVQAGLGWAYLPQNLVHPLVASGSLQVIVFEHMSNQLRLWVDVVWSRQRPLGLGAQRYLTLLREGSLHWQEVEK